MNDGAPGRNASSAPPSARNTGYGAPTRRAAAARITAATNRPRSCSSSLMPDCRRAHSQADQRPDHLLQVFRIPRPLHRDLRCGASRSRADRRASVRRRPRRCSPRADGASSCREWARSTASAPAATRARSARASPASVRRIVRQPVDERLIRLPVLRREARHDVAEIGAVERRRLVDLSRQEALAERAERHEADPEFLERRQDLRFGLSPPQRVLALQRRDRLHGVRAANRLRRRLRTGRSA